MLCFAEINPTHRFNHMECLNKATAFGINSIACQKQQFTILDSRDHIL